MSDDTFELVLSYGVIIPACAVVILGCLGVCIIFGKWILEEIRG